jgi:hypothetical protein
MGRKLTNRPSAGMNSCNLANDDLTVNLFFSIYVMPRLVAIDGWLFEGTPLPPRRPAGHLRNLEEPPKDQIFRYMHCVTREDLSPRFSRDNFRLVSQVRAGAALYAHAKP